MAALPISNSQSQTTTQSPQSGVQSLGSSTAQSSNVQPGTTSSLLNSGSGSVALHPTALSSINLSTVQSASSQPATAAKPSHHTNPVFFGLALVLFVAAGLLFWLAGRAERQTLR
jgi:cobalamin biosynthesis Mg chelatase CobN